MADNDMDRVVPLGRLNDYKVAEGDPDVRGWEVMASDGRKIGQVEELLVDTTAMKVRYLEVDVDNTLMADAGDRHVLIPIGYARLERERDSITVDALSSTDLQAIPAYDRGTGVTREHETAVRDHFNSPSQARTTSSTDAIAAGGLSTGGQVGLGSGVEAGTAGALDTGGGIDTAGLNHTPGTTTGMHASGTPIGGTGMSDSAAGIRSAGSDIGGTGGMSAGGSAGGMGATGGMSAGSAGGMESTGSMESTGGMGGSTGGMSAAGSTGSLGGSSAGTNPSPATGMSDDARDIRGDVSHRSGLAGSDYMHNSDEDFYSSDAFDDNRFYGARRGGTSEGGADQEATRRAAQDATERLREDQQNRGVGGTGNM